MSAAVAALLRALNRAAAAGTLLRSAQEILELLAFALAHPGVLGAVVDMARMSEAGAFGGGSAAVESPAMERADGSHMGGA